MLVDLRSKYPDLTGKVAEKALVAADITVNKNMVPFDTRSAFQTSGIRLGTPAITTRGAKEDLMVIIAELIEKVFVPERSTSTVKVPFTIKLSNPIAAYGVWNKVRRGEIDNISLTFEGRVKVGPVGRNVKTANMPLRDLLKTMGVSDDDLRKLTE